MKHRESKQFATADLHLSHKNILNYCDRPFSSVEEMNETLIKNWNATVEMFDFIYILGDFSFADSENTRNFIKRLNGIKVFLLGSHDKVVSNLAKENFIKCEGYLKQIKFTSKDFSARIAMCHYPLISWPSSFHGSILLYGHVHGRLTYPSGVRAVDVGVDCNNFTPVDIASIVNGLSEIKFTNPDSAEMTLKWKGLNEYQGQ